MGTPKRQVLLWVSSLRNQLSQTPGHLFICRCIAANNTNSMTVETDLQCFRMNQVVLDSIQQGSLSAAGHLCDPKRHIQRKSNLNLRIISVLLMIRLFLFVCLFCRVCMVSFPCSIQVTFTVSFENQQSTCQICPVFQFCLFYPALKK